MRQEDITVVTVVFLKQLNISCTFEQKRILTGMVVSGREGRRPRHQSRRSITLQARGTRGIDAIPRLFETRLECGVRPSSVLCTTSGHGPLLDDPGTFRSH